MLKIRSLTYVLPIALAIIATPQVLAQKLPPVQEKASLSVEQCIPANLNIRFRRGSQVTNLQCKPPLMIAEIPAGKYEITFSFPDHESLVMNVDLAPGETHRIESARLTKKKK